jgi:serine/threonine protein kinase
MAPAGSIVDELDMGDEDAANHLNVTPVKGSKAVGTTATATPSTTSNSALSTPAAAAAAAGASAAGASPRTAEANFAIANATSGDPSPYHYISPLTTAADDFDDASTFASTIATGQRRGGAGAGDQLLSQFHSPSASPNVSGIVEEPQLLFGTYEVCPGDPLHYSDSELYLAAYDHSVNPPRPVILKLMSDPDRVLAELESRRGLDEKFILPIYGVHADSAHARRVQSRYHGPIQVCEERGMARAVRSSVVSQIKIASGQDGSGDIPTFPDFPYALCCEPFDKTLEDVLAHDFVDFNLVRKIAKDIVVGLILLHTEQRIHGDLNPRAVVRVGSKWKLSNLQVSKRIGKPTTDFRVCNEGYMCPEVAALVMDPVEAGAASSPLAFAPNDTYTPDSSYDLFSLGCILYSLVFGSEMWNINKNGDISSSDLVQLARWSPISFLDKASITFPIEERTDNQKAAIDLISKLLAPTPHDRNAAFEFGMVSVRQHEFLQKKPLDRTTLEAFKVKQDIMFQNEKEHDHYKQILCDLSLEERWELQRAKDVLLFGVLEPTNVHLPTSIVILKDRLPDSRDGPMTKRDAKRRLKEAMKWASNFGVLNDSVRGALQGDVPSIGHFWSLISDLFSEQDYMYLYFVDELTGQPVLGDGSNPDYPMEITTRSDTLPKILPLMHLTMRAMALYHGVAGVARMFGCTMPNLPEEWRNLAQVKVNALKQERGDTPFGSLAADIDMMRASREQFMKSNNLRATAVRELVRFVEKKGGQKVDFVGLQRYPDADGFAIWTSIDNSAGFKDAISKRSAERLKEERNHWVDVQEREIDALVENIGVGTEKMAAIENTLGQTVAELATSNASANSLKIQIAEMEKTLEEKERMIEEAKAKLAEEGKNQAKCGTVACAIM